MNATTYYPTQEMAATVAAELAAGDDDDWSYVVEINEARKTNPYYIAIYDEDGYLVARWGF